ncbi:MAG: hypothetical protein WEA08_07700, partial [Woeseia sp.]
MKAYVAASPSGEAVCYQDRKRWWWLLSVFYPLQPLLGIVLHARTGNEWWLLLPLLLTYVVGPLLDSLFGEDENNPPEAVIMELERDPYYRWLTYAVVPMHFASFFVMAWWAGTQVTSVWAFVILAITAGMVSGLAINTGHELGHKQSGVERALARLV